MEVSLLVAGVLGLLAVSEGCSVPEGDYRPPTLEWKAMKSDVVLHGVPLSQEKDPNQRFDTIYSVTFEVRCIYKGAPLDEIIRIDNVGYIPGLCTSTNLTVGEKYLVYLQNVGEGRYTQTFVQDPSSQEYLDEILVLCDTRISYPKGYNMDNKKEKCPDQGDSADCQPTLVVTSPPIPEPKREEVTSSGDTLPANPQNPGNNAPYTPVVAPSNEENGDNASTALTWSLVPLLLVLSTFLL